jgi:hypothetical protein
LTLNARWVVFLMAQFVWCKNVECRIPSFRCLLCSQECYAAEPDSEAAGRALADLLKTGKYRERFVMKRKPNVLDEENGLLEKQLTLPFDGETKGEETLDGRLFLFADGVLKPFLVTDYSPSVLYQVIETFQVESKLVRPEEPGNIVFEGKRPARKTVPILVSRSGDAALFDSWESLELNPQVLVETQEVFGAVPVKQVFVLKRKSF